MHISFDDTRIKSQSKSITSEVVHFSAPQNFEFITNEMDW